MHQAWGTKAPEQNPPSLGLHPLLPGDQLTLAMTCPAAVSQLPTAGLLLRTGDLEHPSVD